MKTKEFELFERYYNGAMEPEEMAAFKEKLANDQVFNSAYQEYLSIYEALSDKDTLDLRMKLREIRQENARKRKSGGFLGQGYNWLWLAALITLAVGFTSVISLMIKRTELRKGYVFETTIVESPDMGELDRELLRFVQRQVDFRVEAPKDTIFFNRKNPIQFRWSVDVPDPVILELIDWNGKIVFSSGEPVTSPYRINKKLPAGIMAYRFRTETESFRIGFLYLR